MKNIYVVIIKNNAGELSTAAFLSFNSAITYCVEDLLEHEHNVPDEDIEEYIEHANDCLDSEMYFESDTGDTYWIEETTLSK